MLLYWKIKVIKRPCWDTEVTVKTWPRAFEKVSSWRDFEMYDEKEEIIAKGTSQWVLVDINTVRPAKITEKMQNEYKIIPEKIFEEELNGKLKESDDMQKVYEYTGTRRDMDVNHHLNNGVYLELAYDAISKKTNLNFQDIEIQYKKQIKCGETIEIYYKNENNTHIISIKNKEQKITHAILKLSTIQE